MAETDSGFMKVLTGNPHLEAAKIASSLYFSNKYLDSYCVMATLFSSFPPDEWRRIYSTHLLSLAYFEKYSYGSEAGIAIKCPYFEFVWT